MSTRPAIGKRKSRRQRNIEAGHALCKSCDGTGHGIGGMWCVECEGTGRARTSRGR